MRRFLIGFLLILMPLFAFAETTHEPLKPNEAFTLQVKSDHTDSLLATWQIAPHYYLYHNKFHFKVENPPGAMLGAIIFPPGVIKQDPFFGKEEVYFNTLTLPIPVLNPSDQPLKLLITYQGCSEYGFCYPPMTKLITFTPGISTAIVTDANPPLRGKSRIATGSASTQSALSNQDQVSAILQHDNVLRSLIIFFGLGVLLAFTPCVLPMIPILSSIIVGQKTPLGTGKAFRLSLTYILAMALTYALAGIAVGILGKNIQTDLQNPWILSIFSFIFLAAALSMFGLYNLRLPSFIEQRLNQTNQKQTGGSYLSVATMGCLATLIMSPCVSAPLVGALAYIGQTGNAWFGGSALFVLGLGMGIPLLIVGTSLGKWLPKTGEWMNIVKHFFGFLMIGMAIWLLSRILNGNIILFLSAGLFITLGFYLLYQAKQRQGGWIYVWRGVSFTVLLYAITLGVGAAMGNDSFLTPLSPTSFASTQANSNHLAFIKIKNLAQLQQALTNAKQENKPVMLDFYADWCVACKEMAATTFANPQVKKALSHYVLLQADVTANNAADQQLQQHFGVVAPPTVLFFKNGEELATNRIVGETNAKDFITRLQTP